VADRVGLSLASYYDLEGRDDEAFTCISLGQLVALGSALRVSPRELVDDQEASPATERVAYARLADQVRTQVDLEGTSPEAWGDRIGWDVSALLLNPERVADLNLDGLRDICSAVGIDWRAVVPIDGPTSTG
jgi:hypothetical protein